MSYAQNLEDVMLWRALGGTARRLVDVGAGEPDADSVTKFFYDHSWHGINVEPMPQPFDRLQRARTRDINLNVALESTPGKAQYFSVANGSGLSTGSAELAAAYVSSGWDVSELQVEVTTLAEVCHGYVQEEILFLKLDVVGGEAQVFAGAEFTRFRPWVAVVESPDPEDPQACREWETELTQTGYQRVYFDGPNLFYVAAEKATLLGPAFGGPPNWLDNYVLGAQSNLEAEVEQHRSLLPGWQSQRERILQLEREFPDTIAVLERERAETRALRAAYEAVARN